MELTVEKKKELIALIRKNKTGYQRSITESDVIKICLEWQKTEANRKPVKPKK